MKADAVLTPGQREVLDALGDGARAVDIARLLDRSPSGVVSSLYALAARGLVQRVPHKGWRRV